MLTRLNDGHFVIGCIHALFLIPSKLGTSGSRETGKSTEFRVSLTLFPSLSLSLCLSLIQVGKK